MRSFLVVLRKELMDCLRDKRSLVMMLLPILIFPLLFTFYGQQMAAADESLSEKLVLATDCPEDVREITAFLSDSGTQVEVIDTEDGTTELKSGNAAVILNRDENGYHLIYDQNSIKSTKALNLVAAALEAQKTACLYTVLDLYGAPVDVLLDYNYTFEDVSAYEENGTNAMLAVMGPMLIVMFIASGGAGVALDVFCGEKERGSLEGLLSTQINRGPLYLAKVVTVLLFVCVSTIVSVGGYVVSFAFNDDLLKSMGGGGVNLSGTQWMWLLLTVMAFAFFTASIICALSISAKTVKEGSLRISLFTLIPTVIGGASMYMETGNVAMATHFIPVINTINLLKEIFMNTLDVKHAAITILSTVVYSIIFLLVGRWMMNSERVLSK